MATTTPRLGLPRPQSTDNVTLANEQALIDAIDNAAAKKADLDAHTADSVKHVTSTERTTWNAKETPTGAQAKADAVQTNLTTHANATTGIHGATSAATASKLMTRDSAGRAKVAAPAASDDIARKAEVDAVAALLTAAGLGGNAPVAADLNALPLASGSGFYTANSTTLNRPAAVDGAVIHIARDSRPSQIFFDHLSNKIYYRGYVSTGWQAWHSVLTDVGFTMAGTIDMGSNGLTGVNKIDFVNGSRISENAGQRLAINAEADRFDVVTEDGVNFITKADYANDIFQFKGVDVLLASGSKAMTAFLSFAGSKGIYAKNGNNGSIFDIDFPELTSATAGVRLFRGTNTTGMKSLTLHAGDGTATEAFQIENGVITTLSGSNIVIRASQGSPEGVYTAPVGSLYLRTDGGSSTPTLYTKTTGTGNTGWTAK